MSVNNCLEAGAVLISIYREDLILSDDVCYQYSTRPREGYFTFSELFRKKYPGYTIDGYGSIKPVTARTINYRKLVDMLKSKDSTVFDAF